jgi:hypothetical protein
MKNEESYTSTPPTPVHCKGGNNYNYTSILRGICVTPSVKLQTSRQLNLSNQLRVVMCTAVDCFWNVMVQAQKPDFFFRRNGRVHLNRRGRQFSRLLAAEVCASEVVMLDTTCSEIVWSVLATHSIRQIPLHFPSRASPCAITFQLDSTTCTRNVNGSVCLRKKQSNISEIAAGSKTGSMLATYSIVQWQMRRNFTVTNIWP